ncbi:MAG: DUF2779 domain-containing protein [Desulfobacterales bacterium]|nr:DUF2779 domain-containing protein [Desulfobacterales bacterium]
MKAITKNAFLNVLECPSLGWSLLKSKTSVTDNHAKFLLDQGTRVGEKARELYDSGKLIEALNISDAVSDTKKIMQGNGAIIFEAAFQYKKFISRADIMIKSSDGWQMCEVKSSLKQKPEFIDDMAYTALIAQKSGININKVSLLHLSKEYRLGQPISSIFEEVVCTDEVLERVKEFESLLNKVAKMLAVSEKPEPVLKFECKKCDEFVNCFGNKVTHHIFDLPRISKSKFDELIGKDIISIADIPDDFNLTPNQKRVRDSVKANRPYIGDKLKILLEEVSWPAYYLDFETVLTAIPLYSGIAPHAQVLTQYSIHKCDSIENETEHFEFLADPLRDSRKELTEQMIEDLGQAGSVIVYSSFEKTQINGLIKIFPEYGSELQTIIDRLVDLEKIIKTGFYHPGFHGSTSIKKTLPILVTDMDYENLEIQDGGNAMAAFAMMALGQIDDEKIPEIKDNLLTYCKQDTYAMVKLHRKLSEFI